MFKFVTALAAVVAMASAEMTFEDYVKKFNKGYKVGSSEWREHASIFAQEVQKVRVHNERPNVTYKRGINKFSDMTAKERGAFFGFNKNAGTKGHKNQLHAAADHLKPVSELPASVDWRDAGIVTPVKDQGHCGSCWAFAATAVLESHVAKESGLLFSLSPQQIASCSPNPEHCGGTGGCEGAPPRSASITPPAPAVCTRSSSTLTTLTTAKMLRAWTTPTPWRPLMVTSSWPRTTTLLS